MRIVVFGSGRMAKLRAGLLREHPDVAQVVLSAPPSERLAQLGRELGLAVVQPEQAFGLRPDGVVISTATSNHDRLLRTAIASGVTAFCEKPLTIDPSLTTEVASLAHQRNVTVQVGYHRRFDPGMLALREAVTSGQAGTLYAIRMLSHDHELPSPEFIPTSGGIFRDLHVHDFDMLRWLTGNEVESVTATGSIRLHDRFAASGDVDTAVTLVTMVDGLVASVHGARHNPAGYDVRTEVFGSAGSLTAGLNDRTPLTPAGEVFPWRPARPYQTFPERFAQAFADETNSFVEVVKGERANPCPPSEDLAAMRVAVACERSWREGRPIYLESP